MIKNETKAVNMGNGKFLVGPVRLAYCHLLEPQENEGQKPKYSTCVLVPKDNAEILEVLKDCMGTALTTKFGPVPPKKVKSPLHDGDTEKEGDPAFAGNWYFNCKSSFSPKLVDQNNQDITDKSQIYSGMNAYVVANFYGYDFSGTKGISSGLSGVMSLPGGEDLTKVKRVDPFASLSTPFNNDMPF